MRIVVKNLPRVTKEDLEKHFNVYGEITEIYYIEKSNLCFIGYKEDKSGLKAIKIKNQTFIKNKRISVEVNEENKNLKKIKTEYLKEKNVQTEEETEEEIKTIFTETLILKNLYEKATKEELKEKLQFELKNVENSIKNIEIIKQENSKKTIAIIKFNSQENAQKIYNLYHSKYFMGRKVFFKQFNEENEYKNFLNSLFFDFSEILKFYSLNPKNISTNFESLNNFFKTDDDRSELAVAISHLEQHLIELTSLFLKKLNINIENLIKYNQIEKSLLKTDEKILLIKISNFDVIEKNTTIENIVDVYSLENYEKFEVSPAKNLLVVYFSDSQSAKFCYKKFKNKKVGGFLVDVEFLPVLTEIGSLNQTEKIVENSVEVKSENIKSPTLILKNIPFQATSFEIRKLLEPFCQIKTLRLPMKKDKSHHRGFCFLELENLKEANIVKEKIGGKVHLYGRRIVAEFAEVSQIV